MSDQHDMITPSPAEPKAVEASEVKTAASTPPDPAFEDLTLAQALDRMRRAPISTLRAILLVARQPRIDECEQPLTWAAPASIAYPTLPPRTPAESEPVETPAPKITPLQEPVLPAALAWFQLIGRGIALALAIWGAGVLYGNLLRSEEALAERAHLLFIGMIMWFVVDLLVYVASRRRYAADLFPDAFGRERLIMGANHALAGGAAVLCAILAFMLNGNNRFTLEGVIAWIAAIIFAVWALAPAGWSPLSFAQTIWRGARAVDVRRMRHVHWTLPVLLVITLFGAYFRLVDLRAVPPEMTSDHVEKLLDAARVLNGQTDVFFANNHGRDAIQFYLLAAFGALGAPLNFELLVLLTALQGIITIPILYWFGRQIIGHERRELGEIVGLLLAAFVAVSYWHEMLSRLGLRIVLTPLFVALVIGFLARGLRYNRRGDFLAAGVALGVGVYGYQAVRMLPIVIVIAVVIALIGVLRNWAARRALLFNLVALALVSFVVFVPLFRYTLDYPEDFWRRTSGRLFGDDLTQTTDEQGNLVMRVPSFAERVEAFGRNMPALVTNYRNAALMFNWKGDVAWINNLPNRPAFDPATGGLLLVGVGAWAVWMIRRRDAVTWMLPVLIIVMMLPSALSIAYPIENPSATRMSGTLPAVYMLVAFPLALLIFSLRRVIGRVGLVVGFVASVGLIAYSYSENDFAYFHDYRIAYTANSQPYSAAGELLRQFAVEDGNGYGNAFIIAYPFWWDHRAVGIEAGRIDFPNTILSPNDIPAYLANAALRINDYRLDPERDLLFFLNTSDQSALDWLASNFPEGVWRNVPTYQPGKSFNLFRAPALGAVGLNEWLIARDQPPIAG